MLSTLGSDGALVLAAAPELVIGPDTDVRYVPDGDLYYLTGYSEPEAVLVLCPSADEPFTMFVRPRDAERERWSGERGGVEAARDVFGAGAAYPIAELTQRLPDLIGGATVLYARLDGGRSDFDAAVRHALASARRSRQRTGRGVHTLTDPHVLLAPMRVRKDDSEIDALRAAATITVHAFEHAAALIGSASHEYVIEAAVEHAFRSRGAHGAAFPTIAAAGSNATVLHYTANSAPLESGQLLLLDAGARAHMYCADVTRTFPVGGTFTAPQRALYDVVLAAYDAAVACATVAHTIGDVEDAAVRVLAEGMLDLGLIDGGIDEVIEEKHYRRYFPHRPAHWLGLDVHDAGDYFSDGAPVRLEPGMVLTVEPGLYVPAGDPDAPAHLRGIGIRLENDVLVTESGPDVLTGALPIRPQEVEAAVSR